MSRFDTTLLSVLIPVYNSAYFVRETLSSVFSSTHPRVEIVVVNDGSSDSSLEIVNQALLEWGGSFQVISQTNQGEAAAVNTAFRASAGEFVTVLNSDDLVDPNLYTRALEALSIYPECVVAYPDWRIIDKAGIVRRDVTTSDYSFEKLAGFLECIPGPGAVIRRSSIVDYLRDPRYKYMSDLDMWIRLSEHGDFQRIPVSLASWRDHSSGQTAKGRGLGFARDIQLIYSLRFLAPETNSKIQALKNHAQISSLALAAFESLHDAKVPGKKLLAQASLAYIRAYAPFRLPVRWAILSLAVCLNPFSRWLTNATRRAGQA
jgi:glycosyltransferase involved in cell wall biosynthesis